jgi:2-polyprenyl-3-methyl-5-hydroxy-6-metoxy-1,4-benzoquinol methylase
MDALHPSHPCAACTAALSITPDLVGKDRLHGTPGRFFVHICDRCGSALTLPTARDDELHAFYPSAYNAYALPRNRVLHALATMLFRWRYWRALRSAPLAELLARPPGRLLDVGGGRGDLGLVLQRHGWRVTSLEPSSSACAEAQARGVHSISGTLDAPPDELGAGYDAVVFQHSLEHVSTPHRDLLAASERLVDGGLLIVTVPNFGCWQRRAFGSYWFHLDLPRHRSHFTAAGAVALLRRTGFEQLTVTTSTSADGLPMSLEYRLVGRPLGNAIGRYLVAAVGLAASPLTAVTSRVAGAGDVLHVSATKRSSGS